MEAHRCTAHASPRTQLPPRKERHAGAGTQYTGLLKAKLWWHSEHSKGAGKRVLPANDGRVKQCTSAHCTACLADQKHHTRHKGVQSIFGAGCETFGTSTARETSEPSQACSRRSCSELSTVKRALTETAQVHFQLCVCLSAQTAQFSVPVHISCGPGQWTQTTVAAYSFQRCWLKRREMRAARPYSSGTCAALGSRLLA